MTLVSPRTKNSPPVRREQHWNKLCIFDKMRSISKKEHEPVRSKISGWSAGMIWCRGAEVPRVSCRSSRLKHPGESGATHNDDPVAIDSDGALLFQDLEGSPDHLPGRSHDGCHLLLGELLPQA